MGWVVQKTQVARKRVAEWFARNFTFKGVVLLLLALAKAIPDAFGREDFWKKNMGWVWGALSTHSTVSVIVVCALFIWLDHRRVLESQKPKPYDIGTLKGRTLKLRDDLKTFMAEVGPKPKIAYTSNMDSKEYLAANWKVTGPWVDRLTYGYELKFAEPVRKIYLEFGERSLLPGIGLDLPEQLVSHEQVTNIIEGLDKLAAKVND